MPSRSWVDSTSMIPTSASPRASIPRRASPRSDRYPAPSHRPLRVYAFDPGAGRRFNNVMTIKVQYEPLTPGPVGDYLAVIDYDTTNEYFYEPVDLDHPSLLIHGGLEP